MQTLRKCSSGFHGIYGLAAVMIAGALVVSLAMPQPAAAAPGFWSPTGNLHTAREWHTATPLVDGRVLVAGGFTNSVNATATAELYNPAEGTWSTTDNLSAARHSHTATLLGDGRVLVVGGYGVSAPLASAQCYNPGTGHWENTNPLTTARYVHTATRLADGRVLVAGGYGASNVTATAQIYNPATGTWANTGSLATARYGHTATLLADGRVLVVGGASDSNFLASAEIFNPAANGGIGAWSGTDSLGTARYYHTATLSGDGQVLVTGGTGNSIPVIAERFDPAADGGVGAWSDAGSIGTGRFHHTATLLDGGRVLLAGGYNGYYLAITQYYSPEDGTWASTDSLGIGRRNHTATLLADGRVLVAGGFGNIGCLTSAEVFTTRSGSLASLLLLLDD